MEVLNGEQFASQFSVNDIKLMSNISFIHSKKLFLSKKGSVKITFFAPVN